MRERRLLACALLALAGSAAAGAVADAVTSPKLSRPAPPAIVRTMDISVAADGTGLPPGSGSVAQGRTTYQAKCASCHGPEGSGGLADRLTGGLGSLASAKPIRTVNSYWPYAPSLFDYIRRAMPLTAPQSLEDREVYGLVAYLLAIDRIVAPDTRLDARKLRRIVMPNRNGFISLDAVSSTAISMVSGNARAGSRLAPIAGTTTGAIVRGHRVRAR